MLFSLSLNINYNSSYHTSQPPYGVKTPPAHHMISDPEVLCFTGTTARIHDDKHHAKIVD